MLILSALLAFAILDRLTGQWSVMQSPWFVDFATPMITQGPLVWFLVSLALAALTALAASRALALAVFAAAGATALRVRVEQPMALAAFYAHLATRETTSEERGYDGGNALVAVTWQEAGKRACCAVPTARSISCAELREALARLSAPSAPVTTRPPARLLASRRLWRAVATRDRRV